MVAGTHVLEPLPGAPYGVHQEKGGLTAVLSFQPQAL